MNELKNLTAEEALTKMIEEIDTKVLFNRYCKALTVIKDYCPNAYPVYRESLIRYGIKNDLVPFKFLADKENYADYDEYDEALLNTGLTTLRLKELEEGGEEE